MKQRNSLEFRNHQSKKSIEAWQNPRKKANYIKSFKEVASRKISDYQRLMLFLILQHTRLFLTDFIQITNLDKDSLSMVLSSLYNRKLITRTKEYNTRTYNQYKYHYQYELTDQGKELLLLNMTNTSFDYKRLLESIQARYKQQAINKSSKKKGKGNGYINIGKNQQAVLRILKEQDRPLFLLDFVSLMTIPKKDIDKSLRLLYIRGFLSREKKINPNYTGYIPRASQYRYQLTESGKIII
jgi:predicted transcriptional regulator